MYQDTCHLSRVPNSPLALYKTRSITPSPSHIIRATHCSQLYPYSFGHVSARSNSPNKRLPVGPLPPLLLSIDLKTRLFHSPAKSISNINHSRAIPPLTARPRYMMNSDDSSFLFSRVSCPIKTSWAVCQVSARSDYKEARGP